MQSKNCDKNIVEEFITQLEYVITNRDKILESLKSETEKYIETIINKFKAPLKADDGSPDPVKNLRSYSDMVYLDISWEKPDDAGYPDITISHYILEITSGAYTIFRDENYVETSFYQQMDGQINVSVIAVNDDSKKSEPSTLSVYIQGP
jgi:hypothetical protein